MVKKESNSELIKLLEGEMLSDLSEINVNIEDENKISLELILHWYMEAEKLIRVFANILGVPMWQAINQLRYAGHHVIKAQTCSNSNGKQQNLIEGYKHCKRSVYDSLDFYVYTLNARYSTLLPLLSEGDASKVEKLLKNHIIEINDCRIQSEQRINYYTGIINTLIKGLDLIEELNKIQRKTGIAGNLLKEKQKLLDEIDQLKEQLSLSRQLK
jgi:hypothetical protein